MIVHRFVVVPVVAVILVVGGCCVIDPPSPMLPAALLPLPGPDVDSLQAHQDSVRQAEEAARAEAARLAAERAAEAERQRAIAAARATLEEMVFFDYDMVEIRDDAAPVLREKVNILRASPQVRLRIEGYCDERGSTAYNLALGNRRGRGDTSVPHRLRAVREPLRNRVFRRGPTSGAGLERGCLGEEPARRVRDHSRCERHQSARVRE